MDWLDIVVTLITSGAIVSIIEIIRNWKSDKLTKNAEASTANTEAQEKSMDLAAMYLEKVLKLTEQGNDSDKVMMEKLESIDTRTDNIEVKMNNIETYLNGPYHAWLAQKETNNK